MPTSNLTNGRCLQGWKRRDLAQCRAEAAFTGDAKQPRRACAALEECFAAERVPRSGSAPVEQVQTETARRGRCGRPVACGSAAAQFMRALLSKNRAWLIADFTVPSWKGLVIRTVGSGRSPVRRRSG